VDAYDLDEVAVNSARLNVKLNKVHNKVHVDQNDLLKGISGPVDLIVGNLLAEIILLFVEDAGKVLKPGGYFITSGIIQGKKRDVKAKLEQQGFTIVEILEMEDWVAIVAQNQK
jgi:ribosomal protein L11 methyltransferase